VSTRLSIALVLRRTLGAALVGTLALGAGTSAPAQNARVAPPPVVFDAPARDLPAGSYGRDPFARVLPSGRLLRPAGLSVVTGMNALGVALSPDGRYAIVTNDDERQSDAVSALDPLTMGGYSLAVVDVASMAVVSRYRDPDARFFAGIAAVRDPANPGATLVLASGGPTDVVYLFSLGANGTLVPDATAPQIPVPAPADQRLADYGKAFPGPIAVGPDGLHAYVSDNLGNNVATIDLRARRLAGKPAAVGFFPFGIAATRAGVFVTNEGLTAYGIAAAPTVAPPFTNVAVDPEHASSLSIVPTGRDGALAETQVANLPMDPHPDGLRVVGGAHPSAIVASRTKPYVFVAMTNVDRIATVAYAGGLPHVIGGTELRLFDRGPYGTQPSALALSPDDKRLYVALAGIDAIAVLDATDPRHLHRLGLIPTGWYPTALALSRDGRYLYVANAKGLSHDVHFTGGGRLETSAAGRVLASSGDSNTIWSTLERIDLKRTSLLATTPVTLANQRVARRIRSNPVVPQLFGTLGSPITHVVEILEENKTYDSMLGDLTDAAGRPYGPGDPSLVSFDTTVTPNLHALARTFALQGNFFADAEESDAGHQFVAGGIANDYTERTLLVKSGRRPLVNKNEDPEDYPRAGYIFNSLAVRDRSFRDYGDLIRTSGYDEGQAEDPKTDDPNFAGIADASAPTKGFGGLYSLDVPALGVLGTHIDRDYPGWNLRIRDVRRASEFVRDFDPLAKADQMPAYTYIWLPADHGGAGKNIPPLAEEVADGDRALGKIVEYLTHLPQWSTTAIFIEPDDAQSTRDHVDEHRSYAIVVSPYAKHHYLGMHHLSTVSVLKTQEELLGLPALSLGDALASDLRDSFAVEPDVTPFTAIAAPAQTASAEGARIAALIERTDQRSADADGRRLARLVDYSRRADRLAARRASYAPAVYALAQRDLYRAALRVVE